MKFAILLLAGAISSLGAELILPGTAFERNRVVNVVYRTQSQATGKGTLEVRWTDVFGRVVEDRQVPVELTDENEISFTLDLHRAVCMRNELEARLKLDGINKKGAADHRDERATASFIAKPDARWWDYAIMMWQPHSTQQVAELEAAGINAGQYSGRRQVRVGCVWHCAVIVPVVVKSVSWCQRLPRVASRCRIPVGHQNHGPSSRASGSTRKSRTIIMSKISPTQIVEPA